MPVELTTKAGETFSLETPSKKKLEVLKKSLDNAYDSLPGIPLTKREFLIAEIKGMEFMFTVPDELKPKATDKIIELVESVYPNNQIK